MDEKMEEETVEKVEGKPEVKNVEKIEEKPELTGKAKRREAKLRFQPASIIASEETDTRIDVAEVSIFK